MPPYLLLISINLVRGYVKSPTGVLYYILEKIKKSFFCIKIIKDVFELGAKSPAGSLSAYSNNSLTKQELFM